MVQKYPAKKKVWGSKVDEIAFLLVVGVMHEKKTQFMWWDPLSLFDVSPI